MKVLGMKIVWGSFWVGAASATLFWVLCIIALYCWVNWALAKAFNP